MKGCLVHFEDATGFRAARIWFGAGQATGA